MELDITELDEMRHVAPTTTLESLPIEGVDYSDDHPSLAGLVEVGKRYVCRYVGAGRVSKRLTPSEAVQIAAHGLHVIAVVSGAEDGLLGGAEVGKSWARDAHADALACGMPPGRPIYFSIDFDMTESQWPKVRDALVGAEHVLGKGRVGIYGSWLAIELAKRDGPAAWFWQAYAPGWAGGRNRERHPAAHAQQYRNGVSLVGGTVDLNRAYRNDFGQWLPATGGYSMSTWDEDVIPAPYWAKDYGTNKTWMAKNALGYVLARTKVDHEQLVERIDSVGERLSAVVSNQDGMAPRITELLTRVGAIEEALAAARDAPSVDPVALAQAIAARPEIAAEIARQVTESLRRILGQITLSGTLDASILPPA